jgi:general secretion pathway protein A
MYNHFFGFKERPFRLVPDPLYLFLSKTHEEALANLTYAVMQGEGFVEITGEVGTGKTTLCRTFLENLDEQTQAAYIFNPKLNSIQLLKAINDEFEIPSDSDNSKNLIDTLNAFLIEKNTQRQNVILVIDEAQNLCNEVLEQLRLLSNLETTQHKLLNIILVGQPELGEKLESFELRQLGQRITLSCRLIPLRYSEVIQYIRHRISIASTKPGVQFTAAAHRSIYKYSNGIPRLINIVCDRALLTAYVLEKHKITRHIVKTSIRELAGKKNGPGYNLIKKKAAWFALFLFVTVLAGVLLAPDFFNFYTAFNVSKISPLSAVSSKTTQSDPSAPKVSDSDQQNTENTKQKSAIHTSLLKSNNTSGKPAPVYLSTGDLIDQLGKIDAVSSRSTALKAALTLWNIEYKIHPDLNQIENNQVFFNIAAKQNDLLIRRIQGDLNLIKKMNLPAILEINLPERLFPSYLTVSNINEDSITIKNMDHTFMMLDKDALESVWQGVAYLPWKDFLSLTGTISLNSSKDSIIMLKMLLRDIGFKEVEISPEYDTLTIQAVKKIQKKYGIDIDGVVGSATKIALYNEKNVFEIPHITD